MAWDRRNGMYYRSRRLGKKVTREYFGNGDAARLASALDAMRRVRKEAELIVVKALRQRWDEACNPLEKLRHGVRVVLQGVRLIATCDHECRGDSDVDTKSYDVIEELRELVALGKNGGHDVLPRIRQLLDRHAEITDCFGDAAKIATELWLSTFAADDALVTEATRRKMESVRKYIAGPSPSPLETLLIDQVMVCWLEIHTIAALHAQAFREKASDAILREWQRQAEASQRMHAASVKQLAELRKLLPTPTDPLAPRFPIVGHVPDSA